MIDRSGKHFGSILNFLRDGTLSLPESQQELAELLAEAKFYLIQELVEQCEEVLKKKEEETMLCCAIVRMPTTATQEKLLVSQSDKVRCGLKPPCYRGLYRKVTRPLPASDTFPIE